MDNTNVPTQLIVVYHTQYTDTSLPIGNNKDSFQQTRTRAGQPIPEMLGQDALIDILEAL